MAEIPRPQEFFRIRENLAVLALPPQGITESANGALGKYASKKGLVHDWTNQHSDAAMDVHCGLHAPKLRSGGHTERDSEYQHGWQYRRRGVLEPI